MKILCDKHFLCGPSYMYFSFIEQIDSWLENDSYEKEMTLRKVNSDLGNQHKK